MFKGNSFRIHSCLQSRIRAFAFAWALGVNCPIRSSAHQRSHLASTSVGESAPTKASTWFAEPRRVRQTTGPKTAANDQPKKGRHLFEDTCVGRPSDWALPLNPSGDELASSRGTWLLIEGCDPFPQANPALNTWTTRTSLPARCFTAVRK